MGAFAVYSSTPISYNEGGTDFKACNVTPTTHPTMDQTLARKTLQELIKREDLDNRKCIDCGNPNPQWASLSFAVFMCLQCAGLHRGFGVHISFVRSVSMDTWQEDQIKRMQIGGNAPFKSFMTSYPAEGGYTESMSIHDKYHCWAASQYKEKLDADLTGKPWTQSAPPAGGSTTSAPDRPSSAQGLRKSRASTGRALRSDSASPASFSSANQNNNASATSNSPLSTPSIAFDQKAANESYFSGLGQANASRPEHLPPSQGGRYQGFGSTPAPSSQNPSYGLSSAAAPSLNDFQDNPVAALSKGWSLFSAAVVGASRVVNENVIQPGVEKVTDPNFQATVKGYVSEAGKRATDAGKTANSWGKSTFGVDVADQMGGVVGTVRDKIGAGPDRQGYGVVGQGYEGESSALYQDDEEFFGEYSSGGQASHSYADTPTTNTSFHNAAPTTTKKKEEDWDDWKDF